MDDNFKIAIGELVTKLRIERGIVSQNMLAQMADVSQSTVRELELGERTPTVETLAKICDVLKITLAEFFVEATGGMENKLLIKPKQSRKHKSHSQHNEKYAKFTA